MITCIHEYCTNGENELDFQRHDFQRTKDLEKVQPPLFLFRHFLARGWREDHFPDISNPGRAVGHALEMRGDAPRTPLILFDVSAALHVSLVMQRVCIER